MMPCSLVSMCQRSRATCNPLPAKSSYAVSHEYTTNVLPGDTASGTEGQKRSPHKIFSLSPFFFSVKLTKSQWNQNVKWKWSGMFLWILPTSMPPHVGRENREVRLEIRWKQILLHSAALSIFIPTRPFQLSSSISYSAKCNNDTSIWYSVSRLKRWSSWRIFQRCLVSFFSQTV